VIANVFDCSRATLGTIVVSAWVTWSSWLWSWLCFYWAPLIRGSARSS